MHSHSPFCTFWALWAQRARPLCTQLCRSLTTTSTWASIALKTSRASQTWEVWFVFCRARCNIQKCSLSLKTWAIDKYHLIALPCVLFGYSHLDPPKQWNWGVDARFKICLGCLVAFFIVVAFVKGSPATHKLYIFFTTWICENEFRIASWYFLHFTLAVFNDTVTISQLSSWNPTAFFAADNPRLPEVTVELLAESWRRRWFLGQRLERIPQFGLKCLGISGCFAWLHSRCIWLYMYIWHSMT